MNNCYSYYKFLWGGNVFCRNFGFLLVYWPTMMCFSGKRIEITKDILLMRPYQWQTKGFIFHISSEQQRFIPFYHTNRSTGCLVYNYVILVKSSSGPFSVVDVGSCLLLMDLTYVWVFSASKVNVWLLFLDNREMQLASLKNWSSQYNFIKESFVLECVFTFWIFSIICVKKGHLHLWEKRYLQHEW